MTGRRLAGSLLVILVLAGGYIAVRRFMQPPSQPTVDEGRAAVEAFLDRLQKNDPGGAWDMASPELKSIEGRQSFVTKAKKTPFFREPLRFNSIQDVQIGDSQRTEFLYASTKSGKILRVLIAHDRGAWKVDRLAY